MKSTILLIAFFLPFFSFAQQTEGEVVYTETVKLTIDLPDDMDEEMKKMIPSSQSFTKSLKFNEKASLYDDWEAGENEDLNISHESEGMEFNFKMQRPENIYYSDLENSTFINSRDFFGRMFLINGDAKKYAWKMTGEQKKISDYVCQKATCTNGDDIIIAWFTPQISVSSGPNGYSGLPGLILEMDINNGERTITPFKIELKELDKKAIAAPDKGKKMSQEEFDKIEAEKMKEMDAEMGGSGGGIKMIIRN